MYRNDNEDYRFWWSEADDAYRWSQTVHQMVMDVYRRHPDKWLQLLDELHRAQAMFDAYYHYALARRDLASNEIEMAEMLASQ